jgi:hypothetical protein
LARKIALSLLVASPVLLLLGVVLYFYPPVHDGLIWRLDSLRSNIKYALDPPEQKVFVPGEAPQGVQTVTPSPTPTPIPLPDLNLFTVVPTASATPAPSPTLSPTPLPPKAVLQGVVHLYQTWNNCGPANLAMGLSFWGWKGNQRDTAAVLKPNPRDKNVMPYEMEAYVEENTDLQAVVRVGGELETLKAFISAGFPVIAEKGFEGVGFDGWMGHYQVVTGYDDGAQSFIVQDSYKGPNQAISYEDFRRDWRAFDYTYLVIYPQDRRQQVLAILGLQAFDNINYSYAVSQSFEETRTLTGRDLFFAWFNYGTNLVSVNDYTSAAQAFDAAFANYAQIPEAQRPWRILWYATGPYFAYYYTARYQDVIDLATTTLEAMGEPVLEESYYWRAQAEIALGDSDSAEGDLRQCLEAHQDFQPCVDELVKMGLEP